jgi:branched-chain amino acid transport system ATP-binding protein
VTTPNYRFLSNGSTVEPGAPLMRIEDLSVAFGGVQALDGVGLLVRAREIRAVIGPNGAGKSSLLNCVCGLYRPNRGTITLYRGDGASSLVGRPPHHIARLGVARTFQNIELFRHLTVLENLMLGRHTRMSHALLPAMVWFGAARRQEIAHRALVEDVIDLLQLQAVRHRPVGTLSYGYAKRVELGRALGLQPTVLLLDEPTAGMNAEEKESMARYILDVNELAGVSVVLVEHDIEVVMDICHAVTVLHFGRVIADAAPAEIRHDAAVIEAYLGRAA